MVLELLIKERFICSFLQVCVSFLPQGYHTYRDWVADFTFIAVRRKNQERSLRKGLLNGVALPSMN